MRKIKLMSFVLIVLGTLASCNIDNDYTSNAEGIENLGKELQSQFGDDARYTDISIIDDEHFGSLISVTVTDDASSLQLGEWSYLSGTWTQSAEVNLQIEGGSAEDFMFNLTGDISMKEVGLLFEESKSYLKDEGLLDESKIDLISISTPSEGYIDEIQYFIVLEPVTGGTTFNFFYDLEGNLMKFDY